MTSRLRPLVIAVLLVAGTALAGRAGEPSPVATRAPERLVSAALFPHFLAALGRHAAPATTPTGTDLRLEHIGPTDALTFAVEAGRISMTPRGFRSPLVVRDFSGTLFESLDGRVLRATGDVRALDLAGSPLATAIATRYDLSLTANPRGRAGSRRRPPARAPAPPTATTSGSDLAALAGRIDLILTRDAVRIESFSLSTPDDLRFDGAIDFRANGRISGEVRIGVPARVRYRRDVEALRALSRLADVRGIRLVVAGTLDRPVLASNAEYEALRVLARDRTPGRPDADLVAFARTANPILRRGLAAFLAGRADFEISSAHPEFSEFAGTPPPLPIPPLLRSVVRREPAATLARLGLFAEAAAAIDAFTSPRDTDSPPRSGTLAHLRGPDLHADRPGVHAATVPDLAYGTGGDERSFDARRDRILTSLALRKLALGAALSFEGLIGSGAAEGATTALALLRDRVRHRPFVFARAGAPVRAAGVVPLPAAALYDMETLDLLRFTAPGDRKGLETVALAAAHSILAGITESLVPDDATRDLRARPEHALAALDFLTFVARRLDPAVRTRLAPEVRLLIGRLEVPVLPPVSAERRTLHLENERVLRMFRP